MQQYLQTIKLDQLIMAKGANRTSESQHHDCKAYWFAAVLHRISKQAPPEVQLTVHLTRFSDRSTEIVNHCSGAPLRELIFNPSQHSLAQTAQPSPSTSGTTTKLDFPSATASTESVNHCSRTPLRELIFSPCHPSLAQTAQPRPSTSGTTTHCTRNSIFQSPRHPQRV